MEGRSLWGETESPEQTGKKTSLFLRCALQTQRGGEQEARRWSGKACNSGGREKESRDS